MNEKTYFSKNRMRETVKIIINKKRETHTKYFKHKFKPKIGKEWFRTIGPAHIIDKADETFYYFYSGLYYYRNNGPSFIGLNKINGYKTYIWRTPFKGNPNFPVTENEYWNK